jgi:hypothetical protein
MKDSLALVDSGEEHLMDLLPGHSVKGPIALAPEDIEGIIDGEKQYGTVELATKGETWYIVHEGWSNKPPKK